VRDAHRSLQPAVLLTRVCVCALFLFAGFVDFATQHAGNGPAALVAHNGKSLDFKYLLQTLKRAGTDLPATCQHLVDTLVVLRQACRPGGWRQGPDPPGLKIGQLHSTLLRSDMDNAHDALADTKALARVFRVPWVYQHRHDVVYGWPAFKRYEQNRLLARQRISSTIQWRARQW